MIIIIALAIKFTWRVWDAVNGFSRKLQVQSFNNFYVATSQKHAWLTCVNLIDKNTKVFVTKIPETY